MNLIDEIRNDISGAKVLKDWWGSTLSPVAQRQADHRSLSCVIGNNGEKCPRNKEPRWWERHAKHPVAQAIKSQMEIKHKMKMETPLDDKLDLCSACGCELTTKIWVNIEHIKAHTSDETISKMPDFCWIIKEIYA